MHMALQSLLQQDADANPESLTLKVRFNGTVSRRRTLRQKPSGEICPQHARRIAAGRGAAGKVQRAARTKAAVNSA